MQNKCKISKKKAIPDIVEQNAICKTSKKSINDLNVQNIHKEELTSLLIDWPSYYRQRKFLVNAQATGLVYMKNMYMKNPQMF